MGRTLHLILILCGFSATILGAHGYVAWRLLQHTGLPRPQAVLVGTLFALGAVLTPVVLATSRRLPPGWAEPVLLLAYTWLGTFFFLFCATVAADLLLMLVGLVRLGSPAALDPERRQLLARSIRGATVAIACGAALWARREAQRGPVIERVPVALSRLPAAIAGLRVVQISDLHVATLLRRPYVEDVVRKAMAEQPDLIVLTGDLMDGSVAQLRDDMAPLAQLRARYGVFFVTGNHEYYSGVDAWLAELSSLGIRPLRNERVSIGTAEASFDLAGIDDWTAHGFGHGHGADLSRALVGRDEGRELVLLAHQPVAVAEARAHGVGLMLSGHTHGGQLWPFGLLVRLAQPYVRGLHRTGNTQIYVNRGTGYWGPPMRLGSAPEITVLTLTRG